MNNLPKGDFNMPPGVRATDIPGNRRDDFEPEDCENCGGEGVIYEHQGEDNLVEIRCPKCRGTGCMM